MHLQIAITVYPKVKVRMGDEDDRHWGSLLSLKDIQFLSIQDSLFPVKLLQDVSQSPSPKAKIPKSYVPSLILPETPRTPLSVCTESSGTDTKSNLDEEEDDRPNIRASSIPPPRAVLSSPQNDALIGDKYRVKPGKRPSILRNQNSTQSSSRIHCKVMPRKATDENPVVRSRKSKDQPSDDRSALREKKGSAISSRRRPVVEWVN
ncbi:unnamed protein product [Linum tenue]|uniref:Uncharacterized protein n=1 Tax=Linum tenue TaxID=586396 RepID=A0AAV0LS31_9ROSI|nr:unnamed protein product [Linum tenue]